MRGVRMMRLLAKKLSACLLSAALLLVTDSGAWGSSLQALAQSASASNTAADDGTIVVSVNETTITVTGRAETQSGSSGAQLQL